MVDGENRYSEALTAQHSIGTLQWASTTGRQAGRQAGSRPWLGWPLTSVRPSKLALENRICFGRDGIYGYCPRGIE